MEVLAEVEQRLVRFVGPIAKVMVRRAAKETTDVVTLTHMLAQQLGPSERDAFLKGAGIATSPTGTAPKSKRELATDRGTSVGTGPGPQRPLTPEEVARISKMFITHVGPIASVLAKRAAKPGCSREQFIASLAACLKDDGARTRFLDSLE